eukprot:5296365-Prymnesium_polylepis.1
MPSVRYHEALFALPGAMNCPPNATSRADELPSAGRTIVAPSECAKSGARMTVSLHKSSERLLFGSRRDRSPLSASKTVRASSRATALLIVEGGRLALARRRSCAPRAHEAPALQSAGGSSSVK